MGAAAKFGVPGHSSLQILNRLAVQGELGGQDHLPPTLPLEAAGAVAQGQLVGRQLGDLPLIGQDGNLPQHIGHAPPVAPRVVDHTAADGAGDADGPFQPRPTHLGCEEGQPGQGGTPLGVENGLGAVRPHLSQLVGLAAVLDDQSPDAPVRDQDIGAVAQDESRHSVAASQPHPLAELLDGRGLDEEVGRPADAEGGVAGHGLVDQNPITQSGYDLVQVDGIHGRRASNRLISSFISSMPVIASSQSK